MAAPADRRDGFTLIGVLVFCLILIPVCASLAQSSRNFAHAARGDVDAFRQEFLAAGIAEAIAARIGSDRSLFERMNGKWLACNFADYQVTASVRDHDGKIDLNNAGSELLIAGFEATGLNGDKARLLQQFTEASRSNGSIPREISELVAKVSLKHAPFEHVDELQDVVAALDVPAIDMARFFTISRGVANIEGSTAPAELQARLRTMSNQGVVFEDNGTFDYADVVLDLGSTRTGKAIALAKTYRKVSPIGDVIEIASMQGDGGREALPAPSPASCIQLLGLDGEA